MGIPDCSAERADLAHAKAQQRAPLAINPTVIDSGQRRTFTTGAQRDRGGEKGRPDLLPIFALHRFGLIMERGAKKYDARNWEQGMPLSEFYNSAQRHLWKWMAGFTDEDHLAQAFWNVGCALETEERIRRGLLPAELNDVPTTYAGQEPGF